MPFDGGGRGQGGGPHMTNVQGAQPQGWSAHGFISGERFLLLDRRQSYYDCTQDDWKVWDFEGRIRKSGPQVTQPYLTAETAPHHASRSTRRLPSSPYFLGLPRAIANALTASRFGRTNGWPIAPRARYDQTTQDFAEALQKASSMQARFVRLRNLGGAIGRSVAQPALPQPLPRSQGTTPSTCT